MRHVLGLIFLGSLALSTGARAGEPVYYELYKPGDVLTDQGSSAPRPHSSLVGTFDAENADVRDDDFAANVAAPALHAGASLFFSLGECYSGGFLDDLAALKGTQSILAAARHTETASYGYAAPEGVDVDFTDAFIKALADGHVAAGAVAAQTAALDPFGPNPNVARVNEEVGSEHNQYYAVGGGEALVPAEHAQNGLAVLWAGMPADRDGAQMKLMIDHLVTMGFARDHIWLLYGGGEAEPSHPIVRAHIVDRAQPIHLLAATREQLVNLFQTTFAPGKPAPDFVFFYVGDHGGLDGDAFAKLNFRRPDMQVTPMLKKHLGQKLYGNGNGTLLVK